MLKREGREAENNIFSTFQIEYIRNFLSHPLKVALRTTKPKNIQLPKVTGSSDLYADEFYTSNSDGFKLFSTKRKSSGIHGIYYGIHIPSATKLRMHERRFTGNQKNEEHLKNILYENFETLINGAASSSLICNAKS